MEKVSLLQGKGTDSRRTDKTVLLGSNDIDGYNIVLRAQLI